MNHITSFATWSCWSKQLHSSCSKGPSHDTDRNNTPRNSKSSKKEYVAPTSRLNLYKNLRDLIDWYLDPIGPVKLQNKTHHGPARRPRCQNRAHRQGPTLGNMTQSESWPHFCRCVGVGIKRRTQTGAYVIPLILGTLTLIHSGASVWTTAPHSIDSPRRYKFGR